MKKALRYVAMVVLALLLIFLSLGLFVPEVDYQTEALVDQPLSTTFALYADKDNIKKYIPEVQVIEAITETPQVVGSKYRMVILNNGETTEMVETATVYEPNVKIGLHFDAGMMQKDDLYTFIAEGDKTKILGEHTARGNSYYARCVFALFKKLFTEIDQGYLDSFKDWAEQQ